MPTVQVDLRNGEQFTPAFRALNPDCMVPVLELDSGTAITDIIAICRYFEELHPDPSLMGPLSSGGSAADAPSKLYWIQLLLRRALSHEIESSEGDGAGYHELWLSFRIAAIAFRPRSFSTRFAISSLHPELPGRRGTTRRAWARCLL